MFQAFISPSVFHFCGHCRYVNDALQATLVTRLPRGEPAFERLSLSHFTSARDVLVVTKVVVI